MIFNMVGAAGGVKFLPQYDGYWNLVLGKDGKSGYAEFYSSGTLTWRDDKIPPTVDVTCIGAGGGGGHGRGNGSGIHYCGGAGGAGGFVVSEYGLEIGTSVFITIGARGLGSKSDRNPGTDGGTTSFGSHCTAAGGTCGITTQTESLKYKVTAGSGGNAGGIGAVYNGSVKNGANGCSNGESPAASGDANQVVGTSQGTPTVDILGRKHAGGGAGGSNSTSIQYLGGASDYDKHSGLDGTTSTASGLTTKGNAGTGGEGAGGGGGGGGVAWVSGTHLYTPGGDGGDGLVVMGWGDYLSIIGG